MGRYFNEKPDELAHGIWSWPNGKNSKDYNHDYYEKHKAKWDSNKSVDSNIATNLANYGYQANGPDQPGLSDDFQRNLAKRRIIQLDKDVTEKTDIANEEIEAKKESDAYQKAVTQNGNGKISTNDFKADQMFKDAKKRKENFNGKSLAKAIMDVPLAAVDTFVQAGKSIMNKIYRIAD